jgi:hypothetical protein
MKSTGQSRIAACEIIGFAFEETWAPAQTLRKAFDPASFLAVLRTPRWSNSE